MRLRLTHLALLLAIMLLLTSAVVIKATWQAASHEFSDVLDDDLENQARLLARVLDDAPGHRDPAQLQRVLQKTFEADGEETLWVTVHDLRAGSAVSNLPQAMSLADRAQDSVRGTYQGHAWQGYQHQTGDRFVQLLRRSDLHQAVRSEVLEDIVLPALIGSAVSLLLLGVFLLLTVRPLTQLSRQLAQRDAGALEPLALALAPHEIATLRDTLNQLFLRVDGVLARERRFASDVAHELRTPLTTLKLALSDDAPDLPLLRAEITRMARVVEQLLVLARLEQGHWQQRFAGVNLATVCNTAALAWQEKVSDAGMTLTCSLPAFAVAVAGDATLLRILIDNLIGNVLRHCPVGTGISLELVHDASAVVLTVSDTGPGIPEPLRAGMTERFGRLDRKAEGLGLGLAICRQIVDVHAATLALQAPAGSRSGLVVSVRFAVAGRS